MLCSCGAERRQSSLNKRLSQLEDACRAKEAERVDLELQLTQVQENLKKSLAGGALGSPVEAKPPLKVYLFLYVERRTKTGYIHIVCLLLYFFFVGLQQKIA